MDESLAPPARRLDDDGQVLLQLALTDEFVESTGPKTDLVDLLAVVEGVGIEEFVTHAWPRAA